MSKRSKRIGPPREGICKISAKGQSPAVDKVHYGLQEWELYEPVLNASPPMTAYAGKQWRGTITVKDKPAALIGINTPIFLHLPNGMLKVVVRLRKDSLYTGTYEVEEDGGHE